MGVTDKIKGAAAAVQDKVTGEKQHAATTAKVRTDHSCSCSKFGLERQCRKLDIGQVLSGPLLPATDVQSVEFCYVQTDKEAHKASEEAHEGATKGHLSQAQGHAKDAAKQAVGAGDEKKNQAKAGHKV